METVHRSYTRMTGLFAMIVLVASIGSFAEAHAQTVGSTTSTAKKPTFLDNLKTQIANAQAKAKANADAKKAQALAKAQTQPATPKPNIFTTIFGSKTTVKSSTSTTNNPPSPPPNGAVSTPTSGTDASSAGFTQTGKLPNTTATSKTNIISSVISKLTGSKTGSIGKK